MSVQHNVCSENYLVFTGALSRVVVPIVLLFEFDANTRENINFLDSYSCTYVCTTKIL